MPGPLPPQSIGFCKTADGVAIAYAVAGNGPPLVRTADWLSHLEFEWEGPLQRHWHAELAREHTLIRFNQRGSGLSDRDPADFSVDGWLLDLEAVVDALGLDRFVLFGSHGSGPTAVRYAVKHPARVRRLVLHGSTARGWKHRGLLQRYLDEWQAIIRLTKAGFGRDDPSMRRLYAHLLAPEASDDQVRWFIELCRMAATPEAAARFMDVVGDNEVSDLLPKVSVPTLVLHARGDTRVPFESGRQLAAGIPGARFVPLDSPNHVLLEDEPAWGVFQNELRRFLGEDTAPV